MILGPDGAPTSDEALVPAKEEFGVGVPQEQLAGYHTRALDLLSDIENGPDRAREETIAELYVICNALLERIKKPPKGRNGLLFVTRAIPIYRDTMGALVNVLDKRRKMRDEVLRQLGDLPKLTEGEVIPDAEEVGRPGVGPRRGGKRANGRAPGNRGKAKRDARVVVGRPVGVSHGKGPRRPAGDLDEG